MVSDFNAPAEADGGVQPVHRHDAGALPRYRSIVEQGADFDHRKGWEASHFHSDARATGDCFKDGEEPRLLFGEESMLLQGFPIAAVPDLVQKQPNSVMADLGGNMVAVPVLFALLMSSVACVHWRANNADEDGQQQASSDESSESSSSELDVATSVLAILAPKDQRGSNTLGDGPRAQEGEV